ncbi:DUF896 domain-containing protein [Caldibacillus thermolactis]|jgi:uncharacterized protein YnzC (UPF0291/DUF896 family)|uniref:UPF0291 protein OEV82_04880 n=1 Tax=Pallidibacillus thermolactis TaxID=251051 RepID=A0ABT2WDN3_9BACI|nr:DUF896 domain-containing protein [Pallidibacillus thermolactis]MCU9593785.1 DUF896 domain-containing protein [Pallidibacillus thermolactis]MCU9601319.1 DUF896 domain-containing protein [Pallidibacillus thermolactis subsp. kokeshiiformis]MED1673994.1 DUF896 domain-containing protein [Pallidibacillus thermolactis subsp. kokeshiiformis]
MLPKHQLDRINALAKKAKTEGLTLAEQKEQIELRKKYIENFRFGMRNTIEGLKIVDDQNNDVTPEKLKQIQQEKGLHNR